MKYLIKPSQEVSAISPITKEHRDTEQLTTCPGSRGPGWMLTRSTCLSCRYYLWTLACLQTKHTIFHLQWNIQYLTYNTHAEAAGTGSHIISLQVRRKEISPSKGKEQDDGDLIPISAAYRIHPGSQINSVGKRLAPGANMLIWIQLHLISITFYIPFHLWSLHSHIRSDVSKLINTEKYWITQY